MGADWRDLVVMGVEGKERGGWVVSSTGEQACACGPWVEGVRGHWFRRGVHMHEKGAAPVPHSAPSPALAPAPPPALAPASSSVTPPAPAPHQSLRLPFPIYIHLVLESCLLKVLSRFAYYFRVLNLFKFPARPCAAHPPPHTTNMEPSAAVCRASRRGVCRGMCCITLWAAERRRLRISDPDAVMPTCRDGVQDPGLGSKIQSWVLRTPPWELKSRLHLRPDSPLPSSPPIPMTLPPTRCI